MDSIEARRRVDAFPTGDPAAAFRSGLDLIAAGYPELLLSVATELAQRHPSDHRMHQLLGLAARDCGETALALGAFQAAAELRPADPLLAHSLARVTLEAGLPAAALFEGAARLAPNDGTVLQGQAAALYHEGWAEEAIALLDRLLAANPGWTDGHRDLAHLRGQLGQDPLAAINRAISQHPLTVDLHRLRISLALQARDLERASEAVRSAEALPGADGWRTPLAGHVASERGEIARADAYFARMGPNPSIGDASLLARHLIRANRPSPAAALLEPLVAQDREHMLWPYLSLAWRMTGNPRHEWLEVDRALVGVMDLADEIGDLDGLANHLRTLHTAQADPLDQSVRHGTQTDGNLLLRLDPAIQHLRQILRDAVARHVASLPAPQAGHPTLLRQREPQRIAGSWSVRLQDAGFHTDHVHGQGWLSSAFYVALPPTMGKANGSVAHDGWLSLGECRELVPDLPPLAMVEPKPGRLVLFPSTMWHGTRPFTAGERLTVAFDIARPKQANPRQD